MKLLGRTALVTGGGSGIGEAIVHAFAQQGANVAMADIDRASVERCATAISSYPGRHLPLVVDCGDVPSIDKMVSEATSTYGSIDILVNSAGITNPAGIFDVTEDQWDRINRLNAKGTFFCVQRVAKEMVCQDHGGRIINIASISGRGYAGSSNPAYAASKGAVIALTRVAAHQLAGHNVNVNSICPGYTLTTMFTEAASEWANVQGITGDELLGQIAERVPLKRINSPQDVAMMALFLAGDESRNITGQSFNVDGGLVMS